MQMIPTSIWVLAVIVIYLPQLIKLLRSKGWFDANKLTLNAGKTQYMVLHRKQRTLPATSDKLYLDGNEVEKLTYAKFLGVIIDSNLSLNHHISNVSWKVAKYIPILFRIRKYCMTKALKLIYDCLIYSNLIYCNSAWGHCKKNALSPLIVIHKKNYASAIIIPHSNFL